MSGGGAPKKGRLLPYVKLEAQRPSAQHSGHRCRRGAGPGGEGGATRAKRVPLLLLLLLLLLLQMFFQ
jgi:hypothetical protein